MHASATLATLVSARLLRIGRAVVDGILPPRCLACGETVGEPDALCGRCWASITFFAAAVVRRLRRAVCPSDGQDTLCGACASERRSWDRARAVLRYDRHSRHLVLGLKHGDRTHLAGRSGAGCTAPEAKSSPMPTFLCRCHCIGPGSFGVATTRRRCRPCRSARPECPRSRPTGWFGSGAHRYKAVSGRRRGRAMSAAPLRSRPAAVSPGSGWLLSTM